MLQISNLIYNHLFRTGKLFGWNMNVGVDSLTNEVICKKMYYSELIIKNKINLYIILVWFEVANKPFEFVVVEDNFDFVFEVFAHYIS